MSKHGEQKALKSVLAEMVSELSKPVAWTDERGNLCTNRNKERGLESRYRQDYEKYTTPFYSQEYVSALLAELEAKDKRIAELEYDLKCVIADNEDCEKTIARKDAAIDTFITECDDAQQRIAELEAKLATPVQLQNCDFESVAIMAHWCTDEQLKAWVKGVEHAKKQIRAAGFKVEGG